MGFSVSKTQNLSSVSSTLICLFDVLCRSDNPEGLDVYMHILQLLTTVDEGIQAIGKNLELLHVKGPREAVTSGSPFIYWGEQEFTYLD